MFGSKDVSLSGKAAHFCIKCGKASHIFRVVETPSGPVAFPCYVGCECDRQYERRQHAMNVRVMLDRAFKLSSMPANIGEYVFDEKEAPLDKIKNFVKGYCVNFASNINDGIGFIIGGDTSIGKTHALYCLVNQASKNGYQPLYFTHTEMLESYQATFDRSNADSPQAIDRIIRTAQLVILDELGMFNPSEWDLRKTFEVVNDLYRRQVPIIAATNLTKIELAYFFREAASKIDRVTPRLLERSPYFWCEKEKDYRIEKAQKIIQQIVVKHK